MLVDKLDEHIPNRVVQDDRIDGLLQLFKVWQVGILAVQPAQLNNVGKCLVHAGEVVFLLGFPEGFQGKFLHNMPQPFLFGAIDLPEQLVGILNIGVGLTVGDVEALHERAAHFLLGSGFEKKRVRSHYTLADRFLMFGEFDAPTFVGVVLPQRLDVGQFVS